MKKLFILSIALLFALTMSAPASAGWDGTPGNNPGNNNFVNLNGNAFWKQGGDEEGPCGEAADCDAEGNFKINTFAIGGGISADGALITKGYPVSGAAGGIGVAGGVAIGAAEGSFESYKLPWWLGGKTITLGEANGALTSTAGGGTRTISETFDPGPGKNIGVRSQTDTYAVTAGSLEVGAKGLAGAAGVMGGVAAQGSIDGSIIGPSPKHFDHSTGVSAGVAAQGSLGGFYGAAGTGLYGEADVSANVDMYGQTYSASYRGVQGDTEYMGTNVSAKTEVQSDSDYNRSGLAAGVVDGGWKAGGIAAAGTVQLTDSGLAKATAVGAYTASGSLGCDFNGAAVGSTFTSATQHEGFNGSIMHSEASMSVSSSANSNIFAD